MNRVFKRKGYVKIALEQKLLIIAKANGPKDQTCP
jgi:hypothetical protein